MRETGNLSEPIRQFATRIAESGPAALGGLYDLTATRLVRYATTLAGNQHDAEDAVQSALVKVAAQPGRLRDAGQPWHYLLRMVRNEALVILRRKKLWAPISNLTDLVTRHFVDDAEREDESRAVWKALRRLPREQSEVVVLKIWEDMTFGQIGDLLGISGSTAASRYRYAIEKLSHRLKPSESEAIR